MVTCPDPLVLLDSDTDWLQHELLVAQAIAHEILEQTPNPFGKLVLISSLRDQNSGEYRHPVFDNVVTTTAARQALRQCHEQAFSQWLELFLEMQCKDLREYFSAMPNGETQRRILADNWRALLPQAAGRAERELFQADLEIALELVR